MFGKNHPVLRVKSGAKKGKEISLRRKSITIGSDNKCHIVIKDAFVEKEHAVLTQQGVQEWEIEDVSVKGTYVDQVPVRKKILKPGAVIRIGQGTLLEFQLPNAGENDATIRLPEATTSRKLLSKPVLIGLGIWYALMMVLFIALAGREDAAAAARMPLTAVAVQENLQQTREFLLQTVAQATLPADGVRPVLDPASDPAFDYYDLDTITPGETDVQRTLRLDRLLRKIENGFVQAWHLEQQSRWQEAVAVYRNIAERVPDIRCPSTALAKSRIVVLRPLLDHDRRR